MWFRIVRKSGLGCVQETFWRGMFAAGIALNSVSALRGPPVRCARAAGSQGIRPMPGDLFLSGLKPGPISEATASARATASLSASAMTTDKRRSRFPEGMTKRKATARARAKSTTTAKAKTTTRANTGVLRLRLRMTTRNKHRQEREQRQLQLHGSFPFGELRVRMTTKN
jgi:hypothetical protein